MGSEEMMHNEAKDNAVNGDSMRPFEELKDKYNDGYRCIYQEKNPESGMSIHLKNFNTEKIHRIKTHNTMEIGQIEDFLAQLEKIKKQTSHDCLGTK